MSAKAGVTSKSSRWAFLVDETKWSFVLDALKAGNFCAAASPVHDLDAWTRADVIKYVQSWDKRRKWCRFFFDEEFDAVQGFAAEDVLMMNELPLYVTWPKDAMFPADSEKYQYSEEYKRYFVELPTVGEQKKPHRHCQVWLDYAMPRSSFLAKLGVPEDCVYYWEPVNKWESLLRYYAHLDSPDKAQYNKNDVVSVNGFDLSPLYRKSEAEKVSEFEYIYGVIRSVPGASANLLTVTDVLIQQGHSDIAYNVSGKAGYWKEILYQMNRFKDKGSDPDKIDYRHGDCRPGYTETEFDQAAEILSRLDDLG